MSQINIDKQTYMTDARFKELRDKGIDYSTFSFNQSYYLNTLKTSSTFDLYNMGKEKYEKYTNLYNQSNNLFIQLRNKKEKSFEKYNSLLQNYVQKANGEQRDVTTTQKTSAAREAGYTNELIHNVNDAELMAGVYLDCRRNAVSMQQQGLIQSVFEK